jgi:class 3 adenylate cyclase
VLFSADLKLILPFSSLLIAILGLVLHILDRIFGEISSQLSDIPYNIIFRGVMQKHHNLNLLQDLPPGTVTFLFTDIVRSGELWQAYPKAMEVALARHDALTRLAVQEHHGHIVKMRGDGVHAVFTSAVDALSAARAGQQALVEEDWPQPIDQIQVRMVLHTGHAQLRDDDYYGPVVNQAVRIQEIAHGGQILLSQATQMIAREELPMELSLIDLGQQHVRDFPRPERIYQLSWPGLDKTFPPLKSLPKKRSNLPEQATKLVGRKDELADINKLLADPDTRLVTIIGPGGMGKTRFSVAAAEQQLAAANFSEGIIFISLAPLADVDQVPAAMADALSLPLEAGTRQQRTPRQQVLDFLRNKEMLLVLDNFEHLLEGVDLVYEILQEAPQVKIVTTSRERLQLRSEQPPKKLSNIRPSSYCCSACARYSQDSIRRKKIWPS